MTHRILIVEDEAGWREHIAGVLTGYDLLEASTAAQACQLIDDSLSENREIELVILDLGLSEISGIAGGQAVLAHLRRHAQDVPCIVVTGRELSMRAAQRLYREYKIFEGLEKPDGLLLLEEVVEKALASRRIPSQPTPASDSPPLEHTIDLDDPPIVAVRALLQSAFTRDDLYRFCQDRPGFRPIITKLGPGDGLDVTVDRVVEHCQTHLMWRELLSAVERVNPRQYARFKSSL